VYKGRFVCQGVQWTEDPPDAFVTFTLSAEELADAVDSQLVWTDQEVQRGILPGPDIKPPRELAVGNGYPDPALYSFDPENADDMAEKLLKGEKLFLNPLVWNLRPGQFEAYWDVASSELYLYSGRVYLPDSHHRHQAIIKAVKIWRESPSSYPHFSGAKQFKVELYFLTREDEGNYFFDKNQRPKPTAKSKAFDLTTLDDLSVLAKKTIEKSAALRDNVNRVTDRLKANNPQVVTLSTLREMMRTVSATDSLDASELDGLATVAAKFYDLLAEIRPELAQLQVQERRRVRDELLVDAAVMMHGYAALMRDFNDAIAKDGIRGATDRWREKLRRLSGGTQYTFGKWSGDFFEKINPLWLKRGVVKPSRKGVRLTVLNTGAARSQCADVLRTIADARPGTTRLEQFVRP
jgi:hypothetical protein